MEFLFDINHLFGDRITRLDKRLCPHRKSARSFDAAMLRAQMHEVIDRMGELSAKAQSLRESITGARKMEMSEHTLYVMKDPDVNNGKGAVVGFLKMGRKKLFTFDEMGKCHEMEPMCALDFYVHESRQRMGCGRQLFNYMLECENIKAKHLAIDRPSFKFTSFLKKHYNLRAVIPQNNNFVIFEGFFTERPERDFVRKPSRYGRPPPHPRHPEKNTISSQVQHVDRYGNRTSRSDQSVIESRFPNQPTINRVASAPRNDMDLDWLERQKVIFKDINLPPRPNSKKDSRVPDMDSENLHLNLSAPPNRAYAAGTNMYSRYNKMTPPHSRNSSVDREYNRNNNQDLLGESSRTSTPPLLQRTAPPPVDYLKDINLHQDFQGKGGHLLVNNKYQQKSNSLPMLNEKQPAQNRNPFFPEFVLPQREYKQPYTTNDNTWTVFGVPNNHRTIGQRSYSHTRLW